jgi:SPW repeat
MPQYLPGISFVLGLWLLIAPYALGFTEYNAFWNACRSGR